MAEYGQRDSVSRLSTIDPEFAEFFKSTPLAEFDYTDIEAFRNVLHQLEKQGAASAALLGVEEHAQSIPMRDGYQNEAMVYKPVTLSAQGSPLIALIYGGGYIMGTNRQLSVYAYALSALYSATVVNLSYRLAPEYKFPVAPDDIWDGVKWLAANAASLGADTFSGFVLGGMSAGGNLTAVTAQRAVDEKLSPPLTGLWVSIPSLLTASIVPKKFKDLWFSREQNADAPRLNSRTIDMLHGFYGPDELSPGYSPFNAPVPHKGLPPTYIQVVGLDPLRDDGLVYERALRESGVQTRLDVYPGVPHGHMMLGPSLDASKRANIDAIARVGWLLGAKVSMDDIAAVFHR